jgi:hypothetical protein
MSNNTNNLTNIDKNNITIGLNNEEDSLYSKLLNNNRNYNYNLNEKLKITRININSKNRNKNPKNILEGSVSYLDRNPLSIEKDSNLLKISAKEHSLKENDRIILQNISPKQVNLKGGITILKNSFFVKINHINHLINKENILNNKIYVEILNAKGTDNNNSSYGNVSMSLINKNHLIYLESDEDKTGGKDYFYIKINTKPNLSVTDNESDIKLIYKHYAGININEMNSNYPISINQVNGFLVVDSIISDDEFNVVLKKKATSKLYNFGGDNVYFSKINNFITGYVNQNNYKINLGTTLENVVKIKMISSEIPNTNKIIKKFPEELRNNLLYFNVLEDGDTTYNINITMGNYSPNKLAEEIVNKVRSLNRINYIVNNIIKVGTNAIIKNSNKFDAQVSVDIFTDTFSMSLFSSKILVNAISVSTSDYEDKQKRIVINHYSHNLSIGQKIILSNCIATFYIPTSVLNKEHSISKIIDNNNYEIILDFHNPINTVTTQTGGGEAIFISVPIKFRLLFNRENTLGNVIGFRNVGQTNSVTIFSETVTNHMPYDYDYYKDSVGNQINYDEEENIIQGNALKLGSDSFIIMKCDAFKKSQSSNDDTFVKILATEPPGSVLFNKHIHINDKLENPIKTLSELEFKFLTPSGHPYEFEGVDHSFTLEFYESIINNIFLTKEEKWNPKEEVVIKNT